MEELEMSLALLGWNMITSNDELSKWCMYWNHSSNDDWCIARNRAFPKVFRVWDPMSPEVADYTDVPVDKVLTTLTEYMNNGR